MLHGGSKYLRRGGLLPTPATKELSDLTHLVYSFKLSDRLSNGFAWVSFTVLTILLASKPVALESSSGFSRHLGRKVGDVCIC